MYAHLLICFQIYLFVYIYSSLNIVAGFVFAILCTASPQHLCPNGAALQGICVVCKGATLPGIEMLQIAGPPRPLYATQCYLLLFIALHCITDTRINERILKASKNVCTRNIFFSFLYSCSHYLYLSISFYDYIFVYSCA